MLDTRVSCVSQSVTRPGSCWGTDTWPDLRLKWPQIDGGRLEHIRLDSTWLDNGMSTSVDFKRLETFRSCDELALTLCTIFVRLTTSLNIKRFSKNFYCQNQKTICNKAITIDLTTTKVCHYTTLWNVSVLKITIKNKTTFVATHYKINNRNNVFVVSVIV